MSLVKKNFEIKKTIRRNKLKLIFNIDNMDNHPINNYNDLKENIMDYELLNKIKNNNANIKDYKLLFILIKKLYLNETFQVFYRIEDYINLYYLPIFNKIPLKNINDIEFFELYLYIINKYLFYKENNEIYLGLLNELLNLNRKFGINNTNFFTILINLTHNLFYKLVDNKILTKDIIFKLKPIFENFLLFVEINKYEIALAEKIKNFIHLFIFINFNFEADLLNYNNITDLIEFLGKHTSIKNFEFIEKIFKMIKIDSNLADFIFLKSNLSKFIFVCLNSKNFENFYYIIKNSNLETEEISKKIIIYSKYIKFSCISKGQKKRILEIIKYCKKLNSKKKINDY